MNPPPNPREAEARAAMMAHNAPLLQNPPAAAVALPVQPTAVAERDGAYQLTWPGKQIGVCCVAGQWRRNEAGDVEAWYSADHLRAALREMELIKNFKLS